VPRRPEGKGRRSGGSTACDVVARFLRVEFANGHPLPACPARRHRDPEERSAPKPAPRRDPDALVTDGLIAPAEAENLARTPIRRTEHPLSSSPRRNGTATGSRQALDAGLARGMARRQARRTYLHIDPLKIDLTASRSR